MHEFWKPYSMRNPVEEIKPFFGGSSFPIHRCQADQAVVTVSQECLKRHSGHRMTQPLILKNSEWLILKFGILK